jgi:hypothetical protein
VTIDIWGAPADAQGIMSRAKEFFTSTVKPTAGEFLSAIRDVRRGRLAAIVLYHMADYWFIENQTTYETLTSLHEALIKQCPDFLIIRDVADASKHAQLKQQKGIPRGLSSSDQIRRPPGLFEAPFGVGVFYEASEVVVSLDDAKNLPFVGAVQSVLSMWEKMLK